MWPSWAPAGAALLPLFISLQCKVYMEEHRLGSGLIRAVYVAFMGAK